MSEITAVEVAEAALPWIWCNGPEAQPFRDVCRKLGGTLAEEVARYDASLAQSRLRFQEQLAEMERERIARGPRHPDATLRQRVYERDGYRCNHCGASDPLTADHIVPWSKGGRTEYENLQTLCAPCNSRKGNR